MRSDGRNEKRDSEGRGSELIRVTGLFATKRKGMYSGSLREEDSKKLAALLRETEKVSIFVFRNDRDRDQRGAAEFVMYAAPSRDPAERGAEPARKPIGRRAEPERDDDLPF